MDLAVKLVKLLGRMFYEPAYFIVMDMVLHDRIVAEDVLAERLQMQTKQVNKMTVKLRDDRFLQSEARLEVREVDGKTLTRTYWYLDFKGLVEATRWRLKKMSRTVESMIQKGAQGGEHGYKCTRCGKTYGLLDVDRLLTHMRKGTLACEVCKGEVEDEETMSSAEAADLYSRMNQALKPVIALLKEIELSQQSLGTSKLLMRPPSSSGDRMPQVSPSPVVGENTLIMTMTTSMSSSNSSSSNSESGKTAVTSVASNEMPVWHSHSTVSGQAVKFQHSIISTPVSAISDPTLPKVITSTTTTHKRRLEEDSDHDDDDEQQVIEKEEKKRKEVVEDDDGVVVMVQGKLVPLMQVTEADKLAMSKKESEVYYEEFMKVFGESAFI